MFVPSQTPTFLNSTGSPFQPSVQFQAGSLSRLRARLNDTEPVREADLDAPDFLKFMRSEFLPGVQVWELLDAVHESKTQYSTDSFFSSCFRPFEQTEAIRCMNQLESLGLVRRDACLSTWGGYILAFLLTPLGEKALLQLAPPEPEPIPEEPTDMTPPVNTDYAWRNSYLARL